MPQPEHSNNSSVVPRPCGIICGGEGRGTRGLKSHHSHHPCGFEKQAKGRDGRPGARGTHRGAGDAKGRGGRQGAPGTPRGTGDAQGFPCFPAVGCRHRRPSSRVCSRWDVIIVGPLPVFARSGPHRRRTLLPRKPLSTPCRKKIAPNAIGCSLWERKWERIRERKRESVLENELSRYPVIELSGSPVGPPPITR